MKIIVHAGMAKTGSSAIQNTLAHNRDRLRDQGIFYPNFDPEKSDNLAKWKNHWLLVAEMHPDPKFYHHVLRKSDGTQAKLLETGAFLQLRKTLREMSKGDVLILSAEDFGRGQSANGFERRLVPLLQRFTRDVFCVSYARPPLSLYPSGIQQRIKSGKTNVSIPSEWITPHYEQHKTLKRIFGDRNILRIFSRDVLKDGDVIDDFMRAVGSISGSDISFEKKGATNESISSGACSLLYKYLQNKNDLVRKDFRALKQYLREFDENSGQSKFSIPDEWNSAIISKNAHAWNAMVEDSDHSSAEKEAYYLSVDDKSEDITAEIVDRFLENSFDKEYGAGFVKFLQNSGQRRLSKAVSEMIGSPHRSDRAQPTKRAQ